MYKLNSMTKEQHLKEDKIDDMFLTENIKENLKKQGFDSIYDIIEKPNDALKAVGEYEGDVFLFWIVVGTRLQAIKLLPKDFDYRLTFTEDTIHRVREAMKKEKLEVLFNYKDFTIHRVREAIEKEKLEIPSNYKDSNRSYTKEDLERELEWFTVENHLKRLTIESIMTDKVLIQKLKSAGIKNIYELVENLDDILKIINTDEIDDLRCDMWVILRGFDALPVDYEQELVFTENAIRIVKARYKKMIFEDEE